MKVDHIFIATKNKGKVREFELFFQKKGIEVKSLLDLEEDIDVLEDGQTFEENAVKKAEVIGKRIGSPVLADDSGLEVDALEGRPGIYSARFAGPEKSDEKNNEKLLQELKGLPAEKRTARFVCVLAVYVPGGNTSTYRGTCEGIIAEEPRGSNGFGYDPLFYLPSLDKTMAELDKSEKNELSHRANALKVLEEKGDF
ncbi:XTP/dITP diphosphatase [Evansella sp. LMS18]|uniref:XTP/dITP diphosphatase n=1 Tax=Evansella sp. LMS18 TaxID=2924033 RepID=UPI0020D0F83F|nr:XTP/dITP diphosphatase [Evansella sp. LMS18]UTR11295.1 XTP/dITP diphosphatase [Evansella sp. LMS18]